MLRYYGLYALPNKRTEKLVRFIKPHLHKAMKIKQLWVFRIELSFHHDPLKCPCGGYMEFNSLYVPHSSTHPPPDVLKYAPYF